MSDHRLETPNDTPKTLPRKKQLCKHCREIVHPDEKIVFESRSYHKLCLKEKMNEDERLENDLSEETKTENLHSITTRNWSVDQPSDSCNSEEQKIVLKVNSIECDFSDTSLNDKSSKISSEKSYEIIDERTSLESSNEKSNETNIAHHDSQIVEDKKLKSISINSSSLNPFDDDDDDDDYENDENENKNLNQVDSNQISKDVSTMNTPPIESHPNEPNEISKNSIKESSDLIKKSQATETNVTKDNYPKGFNPFGSDDEDINDENEDIEKIHEETSIKSTSSYVKLTYPQSMNPFGDSDSSEDDTKEANDKINMNQCEKVKREVHHFTKNYSTSSLERFNHNGKSVSHQRNDFKSFSNLRPNDNSFNQNFDTVSMRSLTPDGKWRSNKKRTAPLPPSNAHNHSTSIEKIGDSSTNISLTSNTSSLVPNQTDNSKAHGADNESLNHQSSQSEGESSFASLNCSDLNESKSNEISDRSLRNKKCYGKSKSAPLPPASPLIRYVDSIEEIEKESDEIGGRLTVNANFIRDIESKLKRYQTDKDLSKSIIKKLLYDYLNLIVEKCYLDKRQIELSYMKCQNKLEKDQVQMDVELRTLYTKNVKSKTFDDLQLEEELLEKLIDVIERKNEIEENIMKIDKSSEFHKSVQKIREMVDESLFEPILKDFKKNHFKESEIRNDLFADAESSNKKDKRHHKAKGFTLKKLSKIKLSSTRLH